MSLISRRESLKLVLGGLLQTAGTVVLASAVLPASVARAAKSCTGDGSANNLRQRADQVADAMGAAEGAGGKSNEWVNGAFRNEAFRNAGTGGGGFRNAGFANGGGGFRNGGFANGAWRN